MVGKKLRVPIQNVSVNLIWLSHYVMRRRVNTTWRRSLKKLRSLFGSRLGSLSRVE